jgi:3-methyladenine DNA glycosylase Tag
VRPRLDDLNFAPLDFAPATCASTIISLVRNGAKIRAVQINAKLVLDLASTHGSAARFFAEWPDSDYTGLLNVLKERGSHLSGDAAMRFLRAIGKPAFITTKDLVVALIREKIIRRAPGSWRR